MSDGEIYSVGGKIMNETDKVLNKIPCVASLLFGVTAFFMLFAPNITLGAGGTACSGLNIAFGSPVTRDAADVLEAAGTQLPAYMSIVYSVRLFTVSPVAIAYLLLPVGVVATVLDMLGIGKRIPSIVAACCFAAAATLFFVTRYIVIFNPAVGGKEVTNEIRKQITFAFGSLVGGIFAAISAVSMLASVFLTKPRAKIVVGE